MSKLDQPSPVVIKLYGNQRLYDGEAGHYRSVAELRAWKRHRVPFSIINAKTGEDVTSRVLS